MNLTVTVAIVGGSFLAVLAVMPVPGQAGTADARISAKIGPGYARMRPIDFGKPERPVYVARSGGTSGCQTGESAELESLLVRDEQSADLRRSERAGLC